MGVQEVLKVLSSATAQTTMKSAKISVAQEVSQRATSHGIGRSISFQAWNSTAVVARSSAAATFDEDEPQFLQPRRRISELFRGRSQASVGKSDGNDGKSPKRERSRLSLRAPFRW